MKRMVKIALVVLMATASVAFAQTKKWELEVFKSGTKVGVMNFELRQEGDKHYAAFVSSHSMSTCFVTERPASVVETDDELTITIVSVDTLLKKTVVEPWCETWQTVSGLELTD